MATNTSTACHENWKGLVQKLQNLNERLTAAPAKDRDALDRGIAAQEQKLLDTTAPSLSAVVTKLKLLWSCQLEGFDPEAKAKRLVLEDLSDLIAEARHFLGEAA